MKRTTLSLYAALTAACLVSGCAVYPADNGAYYENDGGYYPGQPGYVEQPGPYYVDPGPTIYLNGGDGRRYEGRPPPRRDDRGDRGRGGPDRGRPVQGRPPQGRAPQAGPAPRGGNPGQARDGGHSNRGAPNPQDHDQTTKRDH